MSQRTLLVGIGSAHGCDQVGWQVATRLRRRPPGRCDVRIALTPADLLDWIQSYDSLHICDACRSHATEWALHRWVWPDARILESAWAGTHDLSLPAVLQLATALGMAPARIVIWGIEIPVVPCGSAEPTANEQLVAGAADAIWQELHPTAERVQHA